MRWDSGKSGSNIADILVPLVREIEPPCEVLSLSGFGIGADNSLIAKWGPSGFVKNRRSQECAIPSGSVISVHKVCGTIELVNIDSSLDRFAGIQPLPRHEYLLYGAVLNSGRFECNAAIIDADGNVRRTGYLGPGINEVRTTPSGRIIVAYGDEGILGGVGEWGPVGGTGISEFDENFRQVWAYPCGGRVDRIIDCYALNIVGEDVWAYGYDTFDIVKIKNGEVETLSNDLIEGASDILISGTTIALAGGYDESADKLSIYSVEDGSIRQVDERFLVFEGLEVAGGVGRPAQGAWNFSFANGSVLNRLTLDGRWYQFNMVEFRDL